MDINDIGIRRSNSLGQLSYDNDITKLPEVLISFCFTNS